MNTAHEQQRWDQIWALAPYALLALACTVSVATNFHLVTVVIAAGLAIWHWWFVVAHPTWVVGGTDHRPWTMVGYFVGVVALTVVLVLQDDSFQLFVPVCYILAFGALPGRSAYLGVVAANLPWLVVADTGASLLDVAVATPMAALVGGMVRAVEREAVRRGEVNAELVAMAAENARLNALLVTRAREAGVAQERARMAREIHDTVAQGLTGIVTQLQAAGELSGLARLRVDTARNLARTSLVEVRRSLDALRPGPLRDARLGDAVRHTVANWRRQYAVAATFTTTGSPRPVHAEIEVTVLRAAQEALSNVGRHARAGRVAVTLSYMEDVIVLDVRDDGAGFETSAAPGFGLTALRERVRSLAGFVAVESSPGAGTAVSVRVPVVEVAG
ncbi:sensor histidine kinase [Actinokineospora cianjurensis]|uniref:Oxygen sensor histidine kinase NreB n=1 Tax=Actinokineospora cianjurensis TaxID=585224 RepID=A0A421B3S9_9PSEU|nr:sensor histidine kinase [Actinokineospora cianjurensis]RLK59029.1 signal transduction histidine kinase [Actinokineospora cianjurensis]